MLASGRTGSAGFGLMIGRGLAMKISMSKKRFRLAGISLKSQLILSFLAVTLLVLSISSYYSYEKTLDILQKRTQETTLTQFRQIETNTLNLLHEVDKISRTFILGTEVQSFIQIGKLSNADFIPHERDIMSIIVSQYFNSFDFLDSIYLFTEEGMVIGGTGTRDQSSAVLGKQYPFYSTPMYEKIKANFPKQIYSGGYKTSDFMRGPIASNDPKNARLISVMRGFPSYKSNQTSNGVTLIGGTQMVAELVVNVNERYLNSIYGGLQSSPDGSISIVDSLDGKVISSTHEDSIGETYLFDKQITRENESGSFSATRNDTREEVIYYRMSETGWLLINEVPTALYLKDIVDIQQFIAGIFVLSLILIVVLSTFWMNRIMKSFQQLIKGMKNIGRGNIGLTLPKASNKEIGQLIEQFNSMSTGILDLMNKNEETEKEKRQLEIEALQSQINPHFLYNTLNTVKWMAAIAQAPNIMECITSLGNMLRPIYYDPSPLWSFKEEMEFVKNYVNIMNFRYGEEIVFEIDIPEPFLQCQTLRFMIQPTIENSLTHGNMNKGVIRVSVSETGGDLELIVFDTRGGMPQSKVDEVNQAIRLRVNDHHSPKGIGLYNVNKRIQLHFGDRYGIEVKSKEGIETSVFMKIPILYSSPAVQKS
jgi:two-component system sensor histidine kinase YesM